MSINKYILYTVEHVEQSAWSVGLSKNESN